MMNPNGEIASHSAAPPFFGDELARVPGAHVVTTSSEILGHPMSQALLYTTNNFATANPVIVQAARAAVTEAIDLIHDDPAEAVRIYRVQLRAPLSQDTLMAVLAQPGMSDFYP